jgi:multidrug efflux pump subunit AcrA (membrane-fusion protein)
MQPLVALLIAGCLCLGVLPAKAQDKAPNAPVTSANPAESFRSSEITFFGKLYSPLKLSVFLPYTAKIASMTAQIGHKVKRGDILATYEIPLDVRMEQKTNLAPTTIKDLEYRLSVADKELDRLAAKARELTAMSQRNMASQQSLTLNAKEIEVYRKDKTSLNEQLVLAKELLADRTELAEERFGKGVAGGKMPKEGLVRAPSDGYVLWLNPALRQGAILPRETELVQVGTIDPMTIRAQVHEIEAFKIKEGDTATVTFDAFPGRKFTATVARIPWAPIPSALQQPSYYEIELTIANPDLLFKEGLKAQLTIQPGK